MDSHTLRDLSELRQQLEATRARAQEDLVRAQMRNVSASPSRATASPLSSSTRPASSPAGGGFGAASPSGGAGATPRFTASSEEGGVTLNFTGLDTGDANTAMALTSSISSNSRAVLAALKALQDRIRRLEGEKSKVESDNLRLADDLLLVKETADRQKSDLLARSAAEADQLQRVIDALRGEISTLRDSAEATRQELSETKRSEVDRLTRIIDTLRGTQLDMQTSLHRKDEEIKSLTKQLEYERGRVAALEELKRSAEDRALAATRAAEDRITIMTTQTAEKVSAANAAAAAARAELAEQSARNAELHAALDSETGMRVQLASELDDTSRRLAAINDLNKSLTSNIPGSPKRDGYGLGAADDGFRATGGRAMSPLTASRYLSATAPAPEPNFLRPTSTSRGRAEATARPTTAAATPGRRSTSRSTASTPGTSRPRSATSRSTASGTTPRTVHEQLRTAYGGAEVPFVVGGRHGHSHSVLANVQMSIGQPKAYGYKSMPLNVAPPGQVPVATPASHAAAAGESGPVTPAPSPAATARSHAATGKTPVGSSVAAVPVSTVNALLESLEAEYNQLEAQYHALCDAAAAGTADNAPQAAADALAAMQEKRLQIEVLRESDRGTIAGPIRSPVRNPEAVARRVEALRTFASLKGIAAEQQTFDEWSASRASAAE